MKMGSRTTVAGLRMMALLVAVGALLTLPAVAYGQEAVVVGTVSDSTGGVLPGVTIIAVHGATGNTLTTVTDGRGTYRLPLRIGIYGITAELSGFATVTRTGIELLAGQQAAVNLQMAPSTLQESVTVTAEAPLLDVTASSLAANIDAKQMDEPPLADGVIVPRTALAGAPLHRLDVRAHKSFSLGGRRSLAGLVEVFNLLDHENYGSYTTEQSNANYGKPSYNNNVAYQPRIVQVGFGFAF